MLSNLVSVPGNCHGLLAYCYTPDSSASTPSLLASSTAAGSKDEPRLFSALAIPPERPALTFLLWWLSNRVQSRSRRLCAHFSTPSTSVSWNFTITAFLFSSQRSFDPASASSHSWSSEVGKYGRMEQMSAF